MDILITILVVIGLCFFEVISSIENAIINADILSKMSAASRRWFLIWGLFLAVFLVRGLLPWLIVWLANPALGPVGALTATFSNDPSIKETIEQSSPVLLVGGGIFLIFLFLHWLFIEPKSYGLRGEKFFHERGAWFYTVVSIILAGVTWFALQKNSMMAFGAVLGSTAFFITHGFKQFSEEQEKNMTNSSSMSDVSKLLYLEVIDATFSIDGVIGAFAFTLAVPLILIGNGLGALVVRQITVHNVERVQSYVFLKNGAMYAMLVLGIVMVSEAFGAPIPAWVSPLATFAIVGYFFWKSHKHNKTAKLLPPAAGTASFAVALSQKKSGKKSNRSKS